MKFGLWSNGQRTHYFAHIAYRLDEEEIITADSLGYDEAWISEHTGLNRKDIIPATEMFICNLAAKTKQIRMGTAVRSLPLYHPIEVAMQAATCDNITEGRYMLGVGSGAGLNGMEQWGLDRSKSRAMERESLDFILRCWAEEEPFDYDGEFYTGRSVRVYPKPYTKPHMTMAVASGDPETMRVAAEHDMKYLMNYQHNPTQLRERIEAFERAHEAIGKKMRRSDISIGRKLFVGETEKEARDAVREGMNLSIEYQKHSTPGALTPYLPPSGNLMDVDFDYQADVGAVIIGDPDKVYEGVKQLYDEVRGFGQIMILCGKDWGTSDFRNRSFKLFMDEVAPRLRELDPDGAGG